MTTADITPEEPGVRISRRGSRLAQQWHREKAPVIWLGVLLLLIVVSLVGPFFLPKPNAQDPLIRLQGPSAKHWLGTDSYGRDTLSRAVTAGRVSLGIGAITTVLAVALGSALGLIAGYYRGVSGFIMRIMDALMSFPAIVLAVALAFALSGQGGGILGELIALVVVFVPFVARVVRSRTIQLAERGYVAAARAAGVRKLKILGVHILPNALPTILVQATFVAASALLADASLSFLGLGVAPPTPTWGNMIAEGKQFIVTAPLCIAVPGLLIVFAVMAINIIGDGLRTALDPRARAFVDLHALRRVKRRAGGKAVTQESETDQ